MGDAAPKTLTEFFADPNRTAPVSNDQSAGLQVTEAFVGQGASDLQDGLTEVFSPPAKAMGPRRGDPCTVTEPRAAPSPPKPTPAKSSSATDDDDGTIAEYMSRLLQRVSGGLAEVDNPIPSNSRTLVIPAAMPSIPVTQPSAPDAAATDPNVTGAAAVEVRLSKRPPEDRCDLLNMRQVANASIDVALRAHRCKQIVQRMYRVLVFVVAATVYSGLCALVSRNMSSVSYVGAVVTMLLAMLGVWHYSALAKQLSAAAKAELTPPAPDTNVASD